MESTISTQPATNLINPFSLKERYQGFTIRKESDKPIGGILSNKHRRHVIIMTEAGRPVYVRYGDEMEASSFIATLGAILEKFKIFFSKDGNETSKWQKLSIKSKTIYLIYRKKLVYICVNDTRATSLQQQMRAESSSPSIFPMYSSTLPPDESCEFIISAMMDFLNVQMISIMTDQVNMRLASRPNYDPQQSLGDRNQLIGTAIKNGLHSPAIVFNGYMVCPLAVSHRKAIHSLLGEAIKETGAIVALLTTPNYVVDIFKQKGFEFGVGDILLLQNLLQSQNSLRNSHNWIPMCLPGMSAEGMVYVYIAFLVEGGDVALIMVSSQNEIFFSCKDAAQVILGKLTSGSSSSSSTVQQSSVNAAVNASQLVGSSAVAQGSIAGAIGTALAGLPYSQKIASGNSSSMILKHFIVQSHETRQITMPTYVPFGKQPLIFKHYLTKYATHFSNYLAADSSLKKEYITLERDQSEYSGIYSCEDYLVFFILDKLIAIPEINAQLNQITKWIKLEEPVKFITKFS